MRFFARQDIKIVDPDFMMMLPVNEEITAAAKTLLRENVTEIVNEHIVTVQHDVSLAYVCRLFSEKHLNKIPVTKDGVLIGTISRIDVLRFLMKQLPILE